MVSIKHKFSTLQQIEHGLPVQVYYKKRMLYQRLRIAPQKTENSDQPSKEEITTYRPI
jgi:hypothetical protein